MVADLFHEDLQNLVARFEALPVSRLSELATRFRHPCDAPHSSRHSDKLHQFVVETVAAPVMSRTRIRRVVAASSTMSNSAFEDVPSE